MHSYESRRVLRAVYVLGAHPSGRRAAHAFDKGAAEVELLQFLAGDPMTGAVEYYPFLVQQRVPGPIESADPIN